MGMPAARLIPIPNSGGKKQIPVSGSESIAKQVLDDDRGLVDRIAQSGFIFDPVFSPLNSLLQE